MPIDKMNMMKFFISIAVIKGWRLHQLNVKNDFLHGLLIDEIYMDISLEF